MSQLKVDPTKNFLVFDLLSDDGDEVEIRLPCKWEVCSRCEGKGVHTNPAIDGHGITMEERDRDWTDEEWEGYMGGMYDVRCYDCSGDRVVPMVDSNRLSDDQRMWFLQVQEAQEDIRRMDEMQESERRMEA